jgi:hypothetical protein
MRSIALFQLATFVCLQTFNSLRYSLFFYLLLRSIREVLKLCLKKLITAYRIRVLFLFLEIGYCLEFAVETENELKISRTE